MKDFLFEFISSNSTLLVTCLGILAALFTISIMRKIHQKNLRDRSYDELKSSSLYQIEENLKDIQRVFDKPIKCENGDGLERTLSQLLIDPTSPRNEEAIKETLSKLSPLFAEFCSNLDKYHDNIMSSKDYCPIFQEHGRKAIKYLRLFEQSNYDDIPLRFAKLHLESADITY
ncbi:hypothetical protein [Microbulbifer sp. PAAF003]|uniref:hypothetical protein n=1 Tax=Microbulbifer sp. PAAF003 TaxID=3243375 RepID=UPI004039D115